MAPITLMLGLLMISRVPYPSFKTMSVHKRAPIELTIGVLMAAAMLFAMPQLTAFILALGFVLSGPSLMLRGEEMQPKFPVLHPVTPKEKHPATPASIKSGSHSEADHRG
jgi:phosphatidylserine synthase